MRTFTKTSKENINLLPYVFSFNFNNRTRRHLLLPRIWRDKDPEINMHSITEMGARYWFCIPVLLRSHVPGILGRRARGQCCGASPFLTVHDSSSRFFFFTVSGSFSYKNRLKSSKKNLFAFTSSQRLHLRPAPPLQHCAWKCKF